MSFAISRIFATAASPPIQKDFLVNSLQEVDYIPNAKARQLSYGKTKSIGVILPYTNHPYFDQLISGIIEEAFDYDYKVTLLPTGCLAFALGI